MTSSWPVNPARPARRLWIVLFTLSWLPILGALLQKAVVATDTSWWERIYTVAPSAVWLRIYWFTTIPFVGLSLVAAAILLLERRGPAALLATATFIIAVVLNLVEIGLVWFVQRQFSTAIGTAMGIPPQEVGGFEAGMAASLSELVYKSSCLAYLLFGRRVREAFGPVSWTRFQSLFGRAPSADAAT